MNNTTTTAPRITVTCINNLYRLILDADTSSPKIHPNKYWTRLSAQAAADLANEQI